MKQETGKNRKAGKTVMIIILSIVAFFVVLFVIWALMSPGQIRTYDGEKSLSEKFVMDVNGAPNGFFINSTNTDNPVLLFVSSGPGTDDYVFTDKYRDMKIEEDFTIVYWDYRDMGIAYDRDFDINEITLEKILRDTHDVTRYLKERFQK
ncbi:MAG: alpha/beta hydrolase, partial [Lachnospiraceae bacterium]|nr:alpha/beta hydrolase [Lachnospiraceae bacterium]